MSSLTILQAKKRLSTSSNAPTLELAGRDSVGCTGMNRLQSGLCVLALSVVIGTTTPVSARDTGAPPAQPTSCNFLCELQDYLSKDHMVPDSPAEPQKTAARSKAPKAAARPALAGKTVATSPRRSALDALATVKPQAGPKPQAAGTPQPRPRPRIVAQTRPARAARRSARIVAAVQQSAAWTPSPIPGSAPTVTSDFAPAR